MFKFLKSTPARWVTLLLLVQSALLYSSIRPEIIPDSRPLAQVPATLGPWTLAQEGVVEKEVLDVLKADDLLNRTYSDGREQVGLFVAAFKSLRTGKAPHSPKNCLPGSGWLPLSSGEVSVDVGHPQPITVNRYVIVNGDQRGLVMYWYQSRDRVVASEYSAKFWTMMDSMRLHRTDTALVRVIVFIGPNETEAEAERAAGDFVRSMYETLLDYLPA